MPPSRTPRPRLTPLSRRDPSGRAHRPVRTRHRGAALAAGGRLAVAPAQATQLSRLMLVKILQEAGLPAGVLKLIAAPSAGETTAPPVRDPRLGKMSFTGSTEVGRMLME